MKQLERFRGAIMSLGRRLGKLPNEIRTESTTAMSFADRFYTGCSTEHYQCEITLDLGDNEELSNMLHAAAKETMGEKLFGVRATLVEAKLIFNAEIIYNNRTGCEKK